jgi:hypothetical protein
MQTLRQILDEISQQPPGSSLVVFDLDSTLFDLAIRVTAILDRYAGSPENQKRFPNECIALKRIEIRKGDWGLTEPLERLGIRSASHPEFVNDVQAAWARGFFSNEFLQHDLPLPGAVQFVSDVVSAGADVIYLTGRDIPRMEAGTRQSLIETGFPLNGNSVRMVLKPVAGMDDAAFKVAEIEAYQARYQQIWLFENEPVNINAVSKRCPEVKMVFVDTCHSGLEDVHASISKIPHFEIAVTEFE